MIRFEQVSKTYPGGFEALKNVSFQITKGEMIFYRRPFGLGQIHHFEADFRHYQAYQRQGLVQQTKTSAP